MLENESFSIAKGTRSPRMPIPSNQPGATTDEPSTRLLTLLSRYERVLVVMHDNPDPDAVAAGWAMLRLVELRLKLPHGFVDLHSIF